MYHVKQSEGSIQKAIVHYLRLRGFVAFTINNSASTVRIGSRVIFKRMSEDRLKGAPDVAAIKDSTTLWFEVKTDVGRLSPDQKLVHAEMAKRGVIVNVVRSVDDVKTIVG